MNPISTRGLGIGKHMTGTIAWSFFLGGGQFFFFSGECGNRQNDSFQTLKHSMDN